MVRFSLGTRIDNCVTGSKSNCTGWYLEHLIGLFMCGSDLVHRCTDPNPEIIRKMGFMDEFFGNVTIMDFKV